MLRLRINKEWLDECPVPTCASAIFQIEDYECVGAETWDEDPTHVYILFQEIDYPESIQQGLLEDGDFARMSPQNKSHHYKMGDVVKFRGESWKIRDMGEIGPHFTYSLVGRQCGEECRVQVLEWMLHRENRDV
jgi:hypothetical protein